MNARLRLALLVLISALPPIAPTIPAPQASEPAGAAGRGSTSERSGGAARIVASILEAGAGRGTTYHVSSAWATLDRVNAGPFRPGDRILFRRGDAWRGSLVPWSGSEAGFVTYGAYGDGPKPLFLGSVAKGDPADWTSEENGIWSTGGPGRKLREILPGGATDSLAWFLWVEGGAAATGARDEAVFNSPPASYRIECAKSGRSNSHLQLCLSPITLERGKLYRLSLRAKCTKRFALRMPVLMKAGSPWTAYAAGDPGTREVDTEWRTCEEIYRASASASDGRLTFYLGDGLPEGSLLHVDDVSLEERDGRGWLPADVGNLIFGEGERCGVKVWREADLEAEGDYWYDEARHVLELRSAENPAKREPRIECAIRAHVVDQGNRSHVIYENLSFKYGGAHGIGGGNTHHIVVRDCDFAFIGGADQYGGERTVRFGNGIEFWGAAHDNLVERCRLWEIYDAALTNQSLGPRTPQYNIVYRGNVIWRSEYSFEYWNRPEDSETHDVYFINNTCVDAGGGWGHTQRPDPSGRHLCFYTSPARIEGVVIRNNVFAGAKGNAFYAPGWSPEEIDALVMDRNCWHQPEGIMIDLRGSPYRMAEFGRYQAERRKEPGSIWADPRFAGAARLDFRPAPGSPLIDAGGDEGLERDIDGTPIPQGKGPDIGAYELRTNPR